MGQERLIELAFLFGFAMIAGNGRSSRRRAIDSRLYKPRIGEPCNNMSCIAILLGQVVSSAIMDIDPSVINSFRCDMMQSPSKIGPYRGFACRGRGAGGASVRSQAKSGTRLGTECLRRGGTYGTCGTAAGAATVRSEVCVMSANKLRVRYRAPSFQKMPQPLFVL